MKSYVEKYLGDTRPVPESHLEHHGVMGMKWGKRNAETLARYARDAGKSVSRGAKATIGAVARGSKAVKRKISSAVTGAKVKLETAKKERIRRSIDGAYARGDAKTLNRYVAKFSDAELSKINARLDSTSKLRAAADKIEKAKVEAKQAKLAAIAKKKTERDRAKIDEAIRKGDVKKLYKYRKKMSDKDLDTALARIDKMSSVESKFKEARPGIMKKKEFKSYTKALLSGDSAGLTKHISKMTTDEVKAANQRLLAIAVLRNGGFNPVGKGGVVTPAPAEYLRPVGSAPEKKSGGAGKVAIKVAKGAGKLAGKAAAATVKGTGKLIKGAAKGVVKLGKADYYADHPTDYFRDAFSGMSLDEIYDKYY